MTNEGGEIEDDNYEYSSLDSSSFSSPAFSPSTSSSTIPVNQIAQTAFQYFKTRQYAKCLEYLRKLRDLTGNEEDVKIAHNIAVVNYYQSGCKESSKLLEALSKLDKKKSQQRLNKSNNGTETKPEATSNNEEAETQDYALTEAHDVTVAEYNQAVLYFQMKQYSIASVLLENLFSRIESIEETLSVHISFLLLDTARVLGQIDKANNVIIYLEKILPNLLKKGESERKATSAASSNKGWDKGGGEDNNSSSVVVNGGKQDHSTTDSKRDQELLEYSDTFSGTELKALLHLYKAKLQLLDKSTKVAKRNIKFAMGGGQSPPAILLKSNIEYIRDNFSKATKLLNAVQKSNSNDKTLPSLYYNDMGCIYYKQSKLNAALFYFNKALKENESIHHNETTPTDTKNQSSVNLPTFSRDKRGEIMYNNGLMLLLTGNPESAFHCFQEATFLYYKSPRLWLRLAESCIASFIKTKHENMMNQKNDVVTAVIGNGASRRIILPSQHALPTLPPSSTSSIPTNTTSSIVTPPKDELSSCIELDNSEKTVSLEYAVKCLKNVLYLCQASGTKSYDSDPNELLIPAALANLAYVSLSLSNPSLSLSASNELLTTKNLQPHYTYLAHVYAAEALCMLSRTSEAIKHLSAAISGENNGTGNTTLVESATTHNVPPSPYSDLNSSQGTWNPSSPLARATLLANLATVFVLQDDFLQAQQLLGQALSLHPPAATLAPFLLLGVYLELRRGNTESALELLKRGHIALKPNSLPHHHNNNNTTIAQHSSAPISSVPAKPPPTLPKQPK